MWRFIVGLASLLAAAPAAAQPAAPPSAPSAQAPAPAPEFEARAKELIPLLSGAGGYESFFSPGFRQAVPKPQFDAITAQIAAANGPPLAVEGYDMASPHRGRVRLRFRDAIATLAMAVGTAPPHQVEGLLFEGIASQEKSLDEIAAALRGLHGETGFALARLGAGAPAFLLQHQPDRPLAIGSAFKLVILAELVRATNSGERKWSDMVTLDGSQLAGGAYAASPKGTQVSLRELAERMISVSDNSATDLLLKALGREKVEAMLPVVGVREPARNRPFLSTLEAFKLKYLDNGSHAPRYLALDEAGKRAMLSGDLARTPLLAVPPAPPGGRLPARIDSVEWFLSATDLVRVMDWLRRNTEGPTGADARAILSKNSGIGPAAAKWQWVGFKGGSEPGVINMTLLLQAKGGEWYALAASWNDTVRAVEEVRFASLVSRAAELIPQGGIGR